MRSLLVCTTHQTLFGYQLQETEMSEQCSTYGGEEGVYRILVGKPEVEMGRQY